MKARPDCTLARGFETWEKVYAQVSFLAIGAIGTIGVALVDWRWALAYILIYLYGIMGVVMRHLVCPRCPHLHEYNDCLQAPPVLTRWLIRERKTTPLGALEKLLFWTYFSFVPVFPIYWLLANPLLLVAFLVPVGAWYLGQFFRFCKRCRVEHCPFNRASQMPSAENWDGRNACAMSTNTAKPLKVAIIGASGTYGRGILARSEEVGVEAVVVTRSPHKFSKVKQTTRVVETQLHEEENLREAFTGCDGVISALGDDRKQRPKTRCLPHVWNAMKAVGVTKYVGMASGAMMMPGEKPGGFQCAVHPLLSVLKFFGVDMLEQNEWERDSLLMGKNGADGITWVITRVVRPTYTPFVGAHVHQENRGPLNCSIYDHGDFCLYCVASSEWDGLAPHVSSGPQPKRTQNSANRHIRE